MFYPTIVKCLMLMDPERAHDLTLRFLKKTANTPLNFLYSQSLETRKVKLMGLEFPNPIGLAAGLDKDGEAIDAFHQMGFGHVEVGTVTPEPQPGNTKPRMFRIKSQQALINRMGFNNKGVDNLVVNLQSRKSKGVVGVNIGKNKKTTLKESKFDYLACLEKVYPHASYVTVNISSPNTKELRSLQFGELLSELLDTLKEKQDKLARSYGFYVPLALKISPDLSEEELIRIAIKLVEYQIDAIVATNTTINRDSVSGLQFSVEEGGLSGPPVKKLSDTIVGCLSKEIGDEIPIIGVGGINSASDAHDKLNLGAKLLQLYTGLIYKGPKLLKAISKAYP